MWDFLNSATAVGTLRWVMIVLTGLTGTAASFLEWRYERLSERTKETLEESQKTTQQELNITRAQLEETSKRASILEEKAKPRHLTETQKTTLRAELKNCPKGKVVLAFSKMDSEAFDYAHEVGQVLSDAGFEVTDWPGPLLLSFQRTGQYLIIRSQTSPPIQAGGIQACFKAAGLSLDGLVDPEFYNTANQKIPDGAIIILTAQK